MKKLIFPLLLCAAFIAAPQAKADDLISDTTVRRLDRDSDNIPLLRELDLDRRSGVRVNSVIVVAMSRAGNGALSLVINGQVVASRNIGPFMEIVQIPVNQTLGRDIRSLQLDPRGNLVVSMIGVTVEDGNFNPTPPPHRPGPGRPVPPPHRPGPGPQPQADCTLVIGETINYSTYKYALRNKRNEIIGYTDSLDTLITTLGDLQRAGACVYPEQQEISITGNVTINYSTYKNGVKIGANKVQLGYDMLTTLLADVKKITDAGLGYISTQQPPCEIGGARTVNYSSYKYSLSQGDQLIAYSDFLNTITDAKDKLIEAGFCPRY